MANTLVVDDSSVAALNYFDSSFAAPIYDSRFGKYNLWSVSSSVWYVITMLL